MVEKQQIAKVLSRLSETEAAMGDPAVLADAKRYRETVREHTALKKLESAAKRYFRLLDDIDGAKAMLNWGFANYSTVTPKIDPSLIPDVGVINGVTERITPRIPDADPILIEKGRESEIAQKVDLALDVAAPDRKSVV